MFKNRVTIISIILIVSAAVLLLLPGKVQKKDSSKSPFFLRSEDVDMVTIEKHQKVVKLISRDNKWFVTDNNSIEIYVDSSKLLPFFEFANDNKVIQKITKKKASYLDFELTDEKAGKLVFHTKNGKNIIYFIGKDRDSSSQFIRKADDPYVYLVSKHISMTQDKESWYYMKVLDYDISQLDYAEYSCSEGGKIKMFYDDKEGAFVIKAVPETKEAKVPSYIKDAFWKIPVSRFLPRSQVADTVFVVAHKLIFKAGEVVTLNFLKTSEEKNPTYYLDIKIKGSDVLDKKLEHLKAVSGMYVFSMSWFDKNKYEKSFNDFFEDKTEGGKDNSTTKKTD